MPWKPPSVENDTPTWLWWTDHSILKILRFVHGNGFLAIFMLDYVLHVDEHMRVTFSIFPYPQIWVVLRFSLLTTYFRLDVLQFTFYLYAMFAL